MAPFETLPWMVEGQQAFHVLPVPVSLPHPTCASRTSTDLPVPGSQYVGWKEGMEKGDRDQGREEG